MNWFQGNTTKFKTLITHCSVYNHEGGGNGYEQRNQRFSNTLRQQEAWPESGTWQRATHGSAAGITPFAGAALCHGRCRGCRGPGIVARAPPTFPA